MARKGEAILSARKTKSNKPLKGYEWDEVKEQGEKTNIFKSTIDHLRGMSINEIAKEVEAHVPAVIKFVTESWQWKLDLVRELEAMGQKALEVLRYPIFGISEIFQGIATHDEYQEIVS